MPLPAESSYQSLAGNFVSEFIIIPMQESSKMPSMNFSLSGSPLTGGTRNTFLDPVLRSESHSLYLTEQSSVFGTESPFFLLLNNPILASHPA